MRHLKTALSVAAALAVSLSALGQTRQEVLENTHFASGSYAPYPDVSGEKYTAPPKGYKAFYISHYGRHGSRFLITGQYYHSVMRSLRLADSLGVLSSKGRELSEKVKAVADYSNGRYEDLTVLGASQQRGIARRMYANFPTVFRKGARVDCKSSYIVRCAMSMSNFCMELQSLDPSLKIEMAANRRNMPFINPEYEGIKRDDSKAYAELERYRKKILDGSRLASSLFTSQEFIDKYINTDELMNACYETVRSVDCFPEVGFDFDGLFTPEEYLALWEGDSANWYTWNGCYPGSTPEYNVSAPVLRKILEDASEAIATGDVCANLRFGHDSKLGPLTFLLELEGFCDEITEYENLAEKWSTSKVIPMAANLQIIFYKARKGGEILLKVLMNEKECRLPLNPEHAPYYSWEEFNRYYSEKLAAIDALNAKPAKKGNQAAAAPVKGRVVASYVTSWTDVMPDPFLLTHVNYAFGHVKRTFDGVRIDNIDRLKAIIALKEQNPELKVVLSVGGWGSGNFSEMAAIPAKRKAFCEDCAKVAGDLGLDGIDIDWEFPGDGTGAKISWSKYDKENFTLLMKDLRSALGTDRLVTLASNCDPRYIDFKAVVPFVDFVNLMTYDMDENGSFHCALYPSENTGHWTTDTSVKAHILAGVPAEKLVVGVPFYGKGSGQYRGGHSFRSTYPIPEGFTEKWDEDANAPYVVNSKGEFVFGFENERSLKCKCEYIRDNGLLGIMNWEYAGDDDNLTLTRIMHSLAEL